MREPLSREFIESFVEVCMDMGLTKEATAELLQRRSAIHAAEQSPAFASGYAGALTTISTRDRVRVRPGYIEKNAFGKMVGGLADDAGRAVLSGGKKLFNTAMANKKTTGAIVGGTGLAAGGAATNSYLENRHRAPGVPYMAPGGYNPVEEKRDYNNELDRYSRGIANTNKTIDGAGNRRRVLQQAVDSNSPNSAQALTDLRQLDATVDSAKTVRQKHIDQLNAQGGVTDARLQNIQARQQQLRERKQSPFWRGLHWATLRNPDKSYDAALDKLQPNAAALSHDSQLINDQRRRATQNYLGERYVEPSSAQMQREFFPTN